MLRCVKKIAGSAVSDAVRGALYGLNSNPLFKSANRGITNSKNNFAKNVAAFAESTKAISEFVSYRKGKLDELRRKNELALQKERRRGTRNAVIVGVVGVGAGCAAGYALSKAYDITKSDMVYSTSQDGSLFEDNHNKKMMDVPEKPIASKKFISTGENSIMSLDGTTVVVHPSH